VISVLGTYTNFDKSKQYFIFEKFLTDLPTFNNYNNKVFQNYYYLRDNFGILYIISIYEDKKGYGLFHISGRNCFDISLIDNKYQIRNDIKYVCKNNEIDKLKNDDDKWFKINNNPILPFYLINRNEIISKMQHQMGEFSKVENKVKELLTMQNMMENKIKELSIIESKMDTKIEQLSKIEDKIKEDEKVIETRNEKIIIETKLQSLAPGTTFTTDEIPKLQSDEIIDEEDDNMKIYELMLTLFDKLNLENQKLKSENQILREKIDKIENSKQHRNDVLNTKFRSEIISRLDALISKN